MESERHIWCSARELGSLELHRKIGKLFCRFNEVLLTVDGDWGLAFGTWTLNRDKKSADYVAFVGGEILSFEILQARAKKAMDEIGNGKTKITCEFHRVLGCEDCF